MVVLNFWSVECPWAQRVEGPLTGLRSTWPADVPLWPIASNAEEAAEEIASAAAQREPPLVLLDRDHAVADP